MRGEGGGDVNMFRARKACLLGVTLFPLPQDFSNYTSNCLVEGYCSTSRSNIFCVTTDRGPFQVRNCLRVAHGDCLTSCTYNYVSTSGFA